MDLMARLSVFANDKTLLTRTNELLPMFSMAVESSMAADSPLILLPRQVSACHIRRMTNGTRIRRFSHYQYSLASRCQPYQLRLRKLCWKSEALPVHHPEVIHDVAEIYGTEIEYPIVWSEFVIAAGCPYEKWDSS